MLIVQELVIALGYDKCVLVVHNWGGAVGFSFTIKNPEMVDKFVVCNIPHPLYVKQILSYSKCQY